MAHVCLLVLAAALFRSSSFAQSPAPDNAANPGAATKAIKYNSAFENYKPIGSDTIGLWRDINKQVTGGMTSMRSDSMQAMPAMEGMSPAANSVEKTAAPTAPTPKPKAKRPTGKPKKPTAHDDMPMKMN